MVYLDRTKEFFSIVESQQKQLGYIDSDPIAKQNKPSTTPKKSIQKKSIFNQQASQLSQRMQQTADNLQQLIKLVRKRTPFDDHSQVIQSLTMTIKDELAQHKEQIKLLGQQFQIESKSAKNEQLQQFADNIISSLNSKLMYSTEMFTNILKSRTKQIKEKQERSQVFSFDSGKQNQLFSSKNLYKSASNSNSSLLPLTASPSQQAPSSPMFAQQQQQEQVQLSQDVDMNEQYLKNRTDELLAIQKDMQTLNQMFLDLTHMVRQQGELTATIESNVEQSVVHIEQGQNELLKYLNTISSNRGLIIKIFFVLVAFILFLAVFVMR